MFLGAQARPASQAGGASASPPQKKMGTSYTICEHGVRNSNQILRSDQTRSEDNFTEFLQNSCDTPMLIHDLFAVANLIVMSISDITQN